MKVHVSLLLCLCALAATLAQDVQETYGKTNAQILSMGYDKWYDFYTSKVGEHTQGMAQAGYKYAEALRWRNKTLEVKLPASRRKIIDKLRNAIDSFGVSVIQVERALNGGGTMWHLTFASNAMDVEQTLYGVLGGKVKPAKPMVVSKVQREINVLESSFKQAPATTWQFEFTKEDTGNHVAKVKTSFAEILKVAQGLTRKQSDLVLEYCRDTLISSKM